MEKEKERGREGGKEHVPSPVTASWMPMTRPRLLGYMSGREGGREGGKEHVPSPVTASWMPMTSPRLLGYMSERMA